MKNLIIILLFITCEGLSQGSKPFIIKTNSLHYLVKTGFNVSAEVQTKANHSLVFTFEKGNAKYNYETDSRNKFLIASIERRSYVKSSEGLAGFFMAPYLKYRYKDKNLEDLGWFLGGKFKSHYAGTGVNVGYQNFIFKRIAVEAKFGLGIMGRITSKGETQPTMIQPDGIIGLWFGYRI